MDAIQEIKNRLDIVDVVSDSVQLRKSGRSYSGFCPFHPNSRTPAFHVFPETQTWHCFGACADGGDLFSFVMKKEGWDFKEALVNLAQRAGVTLEERSPANKSQEDAQRRQTDLLTAAADYFHQLLLHAPQAEHAREYVAGRQLTAETQAVYRVGFSLGSWDACRAHFNSQGYSDDELLDAGLLTENPDKGTRYDRFRNRLMIPIRDINGRVVGFGARTLEKDGIPKYLNSPQTELFNKSHLLYGLDMAKPFIREARRVVIVEGYMDVMQAWQAGFQNVVAQMGTALTEDQLRSVKRYTKRFVLALDADAAGLSATMRGLQVARETLDRELEVRFDARGLVRHEGRLQADIRVVTLPEGNDPDKIIRTDPAQWPRLLEEAKPVVEYVINLLTKELDRGDAKEKTSIAQQVLPLINDIGDPIERDHFWQLLARSLGVDQRVLRQITVPQKAPRRGSRSSSTSAASPQVPPPPERRRLGNSSLSGQAANDFRQRNYLRQCFQYPQLVAQINLKLAESKMDQVSESDFIAAEDKVLLRHLYQQLSTGTVVTIEKLCDSLDELLLNRVQLLLTPPPTPEAELDRLADTLVLSVFDWRLQRIKLRNAEIEGLFSERNDPEATERSDLYQLIREGHVQIQSINRAKNAMSAVSRRRAEDADLGGF